MEAALFKSDLTGAQWVAMQAINRGEVKYDFASDTYTGAAKTTVKSLIKRAFVYQPKGVYGGAPAMVQLAIKGHAALKARVLICKKYNVDFPGV